MLVSENREEIMCKLGDIIVVSEFKNEVGEIISKHSFVVVSDKKDIIEGLNYDFVSNMLCSFHDEKHKNRKLKYKENMEIKRKYIIGDKLNNKDSYVKADQLYFFNKKLIKYKVIANLSDYYLNKLLELISNLKYEGKVKLISTNLKE